MIEPVYVDGFLVEWGSSFFNQSPVKRAKKGKSTGLPRMAPRPAGQGGSMGRAGVASNAKAIRGRLGSIVKRTPEVMVKISGGGKGMRQVKNHLDYISRNGKIELEDEEGQQIAGRDALRDLREEWQNGGLQLPEEGTRREAFNIVLSMPAGTDALAVKRAARDFAAREFEDHQYVMALHTFDTDPDVKPSLHPHVHLCVKAVSLDGIRLNPRKADLQRWREGFAEALREHGVEATATKRRQRVLRPQSRDATRFKHTEYQLQKTGRQPTKVRSTVPTPERVALAREAEETVRKHYHKVSRALGDSKDVEDRKLAIAIVKRLGGRGLEKSRDADRSESDHR